MQQKQTGFGHLWLCVLFTLVIVIIGLMGWKLAHRSQDKLSVASGNGPNYQALASRTEVPPFNTLPTNLSDYDQIVPLGNINVPDHTQPTDHMYFAFKHVNGTAVSSELVSPGKVVVFNITNSGEKKNGTQISNDYAITFTPCQGLSFKFGHVENFFGQLAAAIQGNEWDQPCERHTQAAGEETFYCSKIDIVLQPSEQVGKVGGTPQIGAFDFGANKSGYSDPDVVDTSYNQDTHAICPLDYFDAANQVKLYAIVKRMTAPRCGEVGQDKANTMQGSWYATLDKNTALNLWNSHLSLVHDNIDPSPGVMGIGGTISQPAKASFRPQHSGVIDREPSETTTWIVYCYRDEGLLQNNSNPSTGKYLVELINNTTLKAEHQDGDCSNSEGFSNPTSYYR